MNKKLPGPNSPMTLRPTRVGRPLARALVLVPNTPEGRLASRIRLLRTQHLLSQAGLAARMAQLGQPWHQTTVAKTERADREMRYPELLALAEVFGLSVAHLVEDSGDGRLQDEMEERKRELDRFLLQRRLEFVEADLADLSNQRDELLRELEGLRGQTSKTTLPPTQPTYLS